MFTGAAKGVKMDMNGGSDKIALGKFNNTVYLESAESIVGAASSDIVYLDGAYNGAKIDLAAGNDKLIFDENGATVTISNIETVIGDEGNDKVTLDTFVNKININLALATIRSFSQRVPTQSASRVSRTSSATPAQTL